MSNEVSYRTSSSFTVYYPDFPSFESRPHNIRIHQEAGKQDVLEIEYPHFSSFYQRAFRTGTLVQVNWNNKKSSDTFYGYVFEVESTSRLSNNQPVIVRCVAASLHLKQGGTKIWTNRTSSEIILDIVKKFKLTSDISLSKVRYSQQSLSGQSYWQKIQELAYRTGYVAQLYGTTLHFHPVDIMIKKFMGSVPVLSFENWYTQDLNQVVGHTLDAFKPRIGDLAPSSYMSRKEKQMWSIDPVTAKVSKSVKSPNSVGTKLRRNTRTPLFVENMPHMIASQKEAAEELTAAQASLSRANTFADGVAPGDPRIAPYRTIEVKGTGINSDGFWVVTKAEHFFTHDGRYYTEFSCMTDGGGDNVESAFVPPINNGTPVRNIAYELSSNKPNKPASTRLSARTLLINETESGLQFQRRRWIGR